MKRFRFPLRPVAVVRAHRELRAREAFAASVHAYVRAEEQLAVTRVRIVDLGGALFNHRESSFVPEEAATLFRSYRAECEEELRVEREVIEARNTMQSRRADYLEASRQLKVINKLEDKARTAHHAEILHVEQTALDDFAGYRAACRPAVA